MDAEGDHALATAGDMNAALYDHDRPSATLSAADKEHAHAMYTLGMQPLDSPSGDSEPPRVKTYREAHRGLISRIDDILVKRTQAQLAPWRQRINVSTLNMSHASDHDALTATLPWAALGMQPPVQIPQQPPGGPQRVLRLPMTREDAATLRHALLEQTEPNWADEEAALTQIVEGDLKPYLASLTHKQPSERAPLLTLGGQPASTFINTTGERITTLVQKAQAIALRVCTTKMTNPTGVHMHTRKASRQKLAIAKELRALARIREGAQQNLTAHASQTLRELNQEAGEPTESATEGTEAPTAQRPRPTASPLPSTRTTTRSHPQERGSSPKVRAVPTPVQRKTQASQQTGNGDSHHCTTSRTQGHEG